MSGQPQVGQEWPLAKRKKLYFTSKPRTKKQKSFLIDYRNIVASKGSAGKDGPSQVIMKRV
jgi:hypothetical protein